MAKTASKKKRAVAPKKPVVRKPAKKRTAPVRKERYKRSAPPAELKLDRLIDRGMRRGFITENELIYISQKHQK